MRTAETLLNIIQDRGKRKLPLDDVSRQLYNPDFSLRSYAKMYKNDGAMTPGTTEETVDGMSLNKIDQVIEVIRCERWKWPPVRRVLIDKPQGGKRPLGIPDWSPKVVQDIVRSILEAYYEPQFSDHSHGFRPKRGCQSALTKIHNTWNGTTWFIEGDIKGCFENIDHHLLMNILRENIHDNRFLRLIEGALKAGYCEDWIYHPSLSGSPQGGIVSPILSNIYLDKLDKFVEKTLIPEYTKSDKRETNPAYGHVANQLQTARRQGNLERVRALQKELRKHPSKTQDDPGYRRLRYIRYADDFLFGFAGPFEESHQMKEKVASFLQTELKLPLSAEKTLMTHAHTGRARFLGYEIGIMYSATKLDDRFRRSVNGAVGMYIPEDVIQAKRKRYLRDGKPIHRPELQNDSEYDIIVRYQGEYRGLVQYYGLAQNLAQLGYVVGTKFTRPSVERLSRTASRRILGSLPFPAARRRIAHGYRTLPPTLAWRTRSSPPARRVRSGNPSHPPVGGYVPVGRHGASGGAEFCPAFSQKAPHWGATVGLTPGVAGLGTPQTRAERIR